jgi:selenocysteine lyase/cysteine desulfurase
MKNLKDSNSDFILFSIYKITGLPQGLGVLLIKKSAACLLDKKYFGGGTIHSIIPSTLDMVPRPFQEYYEDGTIPYMNIIIAHKALQFIQPLITSRMKETLLLTNYFITNLIELGYIVYSLWDNGSIVTFNHKTIGHKTIESLLESHGIRCRTGCFCNPGACQQQLCLTDKDLLFFRKSKHGLLVLLGQQNDAAFLRLSLIVDTIRESGVNDASLTTSTVAFSATMLRPTCPTESTPRHPGQSFLFGPFRLCGEKVI